MSDSAKTRVAAYGLVLRQQEVLLCRIAPRVAEWAGFWTLPGGGIAFGEDPEQAMVREVQEETGLHVRATGVAGVDSLVVPNGGATTHSLRIIYFAEILGGALKNEVDGSTDLCAWHDRTAVQSLPIVSLVERGLDLAGSLSYLRDRGADGSREAYLEALDQVPDLPPLPGDELPEDK